jgi:hypothetical protein
MFNIENNLVLSFTEKMFHKITKIHCKENHHVPKWDERGKPSRKG